MTEISFTGVTPYLYYPDGDAAAAWLLRVFGFGPARSMRGADGRWAEGEVAIGDGRIDISGGRDGNGQLLIVSVDDVDALHARIVGAGVAADDPEGRGVRSADLSRHRSLGLPVVLLAGRGDVRLSRLPPRSPWRDPRSNPDTMVPPGSVICLFGPKVCR